MRFMVLSSFSTASHLLTTMMHGLARLVGQAGHFGILLGDSLVGVDHDEAHVAALNSHGRPQDENFSIRSSTLDFCGASRRYR